MARSVLLAKVFIAGMALLFAVLVANPAFAQQPFGAPAFGMGAFAPNPFEPAAPPRPRVYIPAPRAPQLTYCVRTCDGRYFPYPNESGERDVKACDAVCPSSDMKLYAGAEIKTATSEQRKPYSKLTNAFRFQREMVANCTCNAHTGLGLTPIAIKDDRTLRTGDIVAESKRLMVAEVSGGTERRTRSIVFRPLSAANARAFGLANASLSRASFSKRERSKASTD